MTALITLRAWNPKHPWSGCWHSSGLLFSFAASSATASFPFHSHPRPARIEFPPMRLLRTIWVLLLWAACSGVVIRQEFVEFRLLGLFRRQLPISKISKLVLRRSTMFVRLKRKAHNEGRTSVLFVSTKGPAMYFQPEDIREFLSTFRTVAPDVPLVCKPRRKLIFELA